jgi:hypothetical protein
MIANHKGNDRARTTDCSLPQMVTGTTEDTPSTLENRIRSAMRLASRTAVALHAVAACSLGPQSRKVPLRAQRAPPDTGCGTSYV